MATRGVKKIKQTAAPKKKVKRRATSVATLKLGDEPSFIFEPDTAQLVRALNWYTTCADDPEAHKEWVTEYLTRRGWKKDEIRTVTAKIKKLPGTYIFVARMCNREQPIDIKYDADALSYFQSVLLSQSDEYDADGNPVEKQAAVVPKPNKNIGALVNFIEEQIESVMAGATPSSVYTKLTELGCNASLAVQLKKVFAFQTAEFVELSRSATCDRDLEAAYSHLDMITRRKLGEFMKLINTDLASFASVAKATRKPRKKKPVKVEKLVARVKYKAKDDQYKIASITPDKIVGASWVWVFNTKYRLIQWYEAEDKLSIKGTSILGYKASGQKKLRKPEQQLQLFTSGGVKALPKNFASIKTAENEAAGRLNADCVILRVFSN